MTKPGLTNLLDETLRALEARGHHQDDVLWVGTKDWSCPFSEFAARAKSINYDSGFGLAVIRRDLVIAGHDWWLERGEYDGSEWWAYKFPPIQPPRDTCGNLLDNTADLVSRMDDLDTQRTAIRRDLEAARIERAGAVEVNRLIQDLSDIGAEITALKKEIDES